jgi:hypothetical protein
MHWSWKKYPAAWHAYFKRPQKDSTIILEIITRFRFSIFYSECAVHAMTSTFSNGHH